MAAAAVADVDRVRPFVDRFVSAGRDGKEVVYLCCLVHLIPSLELLKC